MFNTSRNRRRDSRFPAKISGGLGSGLRHESNGTGLTLSRDRCCEIEERERVGVESEEREGAYAGDREKLRGKSEKSDF